MISQTQVHFGKTEEAYDSFSNLLKTIISKHKFDKILDVGGGAQPLFSVAYITENQLDYTVLDISEEELLNAPVQYKKCILDIAVPDITFDRKYDFVFSRFMAEHVKDAKALHKNVFNALRPGGMAVHFFPTLYVFPFLVNWLLPNRIAALFLPRARRVKCKFPAYYKWCVGPSEKSIARLSGLGYEVIEYAGFFGHGYYDRFVGFREIQRFLRNILLRQQVSLLTSFAWVILKKPE